MKRFFLLFLTLFVLAGAGCVEPQMTVKSPPVEPVAVQEQEVVPAPTSTEAPPLEQSSENSPTVEAAVEVEEKPPIVQTQVKTVPAVVPKVTSPPSTSGYKSPFAPVVETEQLSKPEPTPEPQPVPAPDPEPVQVVPSAPNGTYTNVYGNEVPSPYYAPSAPAGASARCGDGTYSFSQSRRGTCSHHGGVDEWL